MSCSIRRRSSTRARTIGFGGDLGAGLWRAASRESQVVAVLVELTEAILDAAGQTDQARAIGERAIDRLPDPPAA
jgi:hypothetical protein